MKRNIFVSLALSAVFMFCAAIPAMAADTTPPVVGAISPTTVTADATVIYSATYVDSGAGGVYQCRLNADGNIVWTSAAFAPNTTSGVISVAESFSAGTHYLQFQCVDNANNWGYGPQATVTAYADTTPPTVGAVSPTTASAGTSVNYSATYADSGTGVKQCRLNINGNIAWTSTVFPADTYSGTISVNESLTASSNYLQFQCVDNANNWGYGPQTTVTVSTSGEIAPTVGAIQQTNAVKGVATHLSANVSGSISECSLYVGGAGVGYMTVANGLASADYIFNGTSQLVHVVCISPGGYIGIGPDVTVNVLPSTNIAYGTVIKLACLANAAADHPCKTVYYFGADGKRHAFTNSRIYFTWYSNFDAVQEVSDAQMAAMPLGSNVRYKPGVRMVKFTTLNKVYALSGYGTLRWVTTEALAAAFYTAEWNKQIDDIPDTFYADYKFGADITDVSQYNPVGESNGWGNLVDY